jgi:hypothetical protein
MKTKELRPDQPVAEVIEGWLLGRPPCEAHRAELARHPMTVHAALRHQDAVSRRSSPTLARIISAVGALVGDAKLRKWNRALGSPPLPGWASEDADLPAHAARLFGHGLAAGVTEADVRCAAGKLGV